MVWFDGASRKEEERVRVKYGIVISMIVEGIKNWIVVWCKTTVVLEKWWRIIVLEIASNLIWKNINGKKLVEDDTWSVNRKKNVLQDGSNCSALSADIIDGKISNVNNQGTSKRDLTRVTWYNFWAGSNLTRTSMPNS